MPESFGAQEIQHAGAHHHNPKTDPRHRTPGFQRCQFRHQVHRGYIKVHEGEAFLEKAQVLCALLVPRIEEQSPLEPKRGMAGLFEFQFRATKVVGKFSREVNAGLPLEFLQSFRKLPGFLSRASRLKIGHGARDENQEQKQYK